MESAPEELEEALSRELRGESILWAGRPHRWDYAKPFWTRAAFGIPFLAFAIFWTYSAYHGAARAHPLQGDEIFVHLFPPWGLMFVAIGSSMVLSPFYMAWRARNVYYVVTGRRAVIFEKIWRLKIRSFNSQAIANFDRTSWGGSRGNIVFLRLPSDRHRMGYPKEIGFIGIKDVALAESALARLASSRSDVP